MVVGEVGAAEGAVAALGFVEHRDMRLDPTLMDQPGEVLDRAMGAVGGEPRGPEAKALLRSVEHGAGRADLGLPDGATGLEIDDDGVIEIDQIVGGVADEQHPVHQFRIDRGPSRLAVEGTQMRGYTRDQRRDRWRTQ